MRKILMLVLLLFSFGCFSIPTMGSVDSSQYQVQDNNYEVLGRVTGRAETIRIALLIRIGPGDLYNRAMMELSDKAGVYGDHVALINVSVDYWFDSIALVFGKDIVSISADVIRYK